jgi:hypothetical protein
MESEEARGEMVDHNYNIARRHYSFNVLRNTLDSLMRGLFGDETACLGCAVKNYRNIVYLNTGKDHLNGSLFDHSVINTSMAEG